MASSRCVRARARGSARAHRSRVAATQAKLKRKQENNMGLFNDWLGRAGHQVVAKWDKVDGTRQLKGWYRKLVSW